MKSIRYIAASSALVLALVTASPVLADSDNKEKRDGEHKFGINLGGLIKAQHEDNRDGDKKEKKEKHDKDDHADSISGTVAGLNGATITVTGANGTVYSVNAASSTVNGSSDTSMLGKIQIGDRIHVKGTVTGTTVVATKITDKTLKSRLMLAEQSGVRAGTVTSVSGNLITINRFGTGTTTVNTSASTFFAAGGSATSSAAISVGSKIIAFGPTTTGVNDSIQASVVLLLNHSVNFLKHLFR